MSGVRLYLIFNRWPLRRATRVMQSYGTIRFGRGEEKENGGRRSSIGTGWRRQWCLPVGRWRYRACTIAAPNVNEIASNVFDL